MERESGAGGTWRVGAAIAAESRAESKSLELVGVGLGDVKYLAPSTGSEEPDTNESPAA